MNKKMNALLVSLLVTVGLFVYLTLHHYAVKLGISADGICSINEKLNCDAAATSSFSELFGTPVAVLGGTFHFLLFGFILFLKFDWLEKTVYSQTTLRALLAIAAIVSVVMGLISIIYVKVYCPFCMATYVMSFINLALGWNLFLVSEKLQPRLFLNQYRAYFIFLVSIPVIAWMIAGMLQENNGLAEVKKMIPEKIEQWRSSPVYLFNSTDGLTRLGLAAKITVVEFADFKCPHCKNAATTIDSFMKGNPEVTFVFKPYPLDGNCNNAISTKGDGSRCTLAAWVLCAEKNDHRGWDLHHWIFKKQEELFQVTDFKPYLAELEKNFKIDTAKLTACSESNETYELIRHLADEGTKAQVNGTPTIFMNGKKLPYGQFPDVLKAAASEIH